MIYDSLGDRQQDYESCYDTKITNRIPVVIRVDGRSFSRLCRKLQKPYDPLMLEVMVDTMFFIASEMGGAVFAYQQSDEITFILRNDQTLDTQPWYGNRIQKTVSIASSLATLGFQKSLQKLDSKLELIGDALFDARVFALPSLGECVNNLIWRQQDCVRNTVSMTAQTIIGRKYGKKTANSILHGKKTEQKIQIMKDECGIDFEHEFPASYRMGVAAYKVPQIIPTKSGEESTRKKWIIDWELPNFVLERDFIYNILCTGHDVFRAENLQM